MENDADNATDAASVADILKHAGGSRSDAWNNYIGAQALASIRPYIGDEEKRDKMRAIVTAGHRATGGANKTLAMNPVVLKEAGGYFG